MKKNLYESSLVDSRMEAYLQKIATGPKMSKDLSEAEAEDALTLILREEVSKIRSAIFLIAARMKLETLEENIGYWKAMDKTTIRNPIQLDHLLQIADPFDGFNRAPYFGFYTIPVLAAIGLPTYGHSAPSLPPKFGLTFEDILNKHYAIEPKIFVIQKGGAMKITAGSVVRYVTGEHSIYTNATRPSSISMGCFYRYNDAVIASLFYDYHRSLSVGVSYDLNISALRAVTALRGGIEISLIFKGFYENQHIKL